MTGKKKVTKQSLLEELKALYNQVVRLQIRTARSLVPIGVWDNVLDIQNAIQDAIDTVECWEEH